MRLFQHKNVAFSVSDPCRVRRPLAVSPYAAASSPVVEVAIRPTLSPTTLSPRSAAAGSQHHSPVTATITVPFATSIRARRRVPTPLSFCGVETTDRLLLSPTFSPGGFYSPSIVVSSFLRSAQHTGTGQSTEQTEQYSTELFMSGMYRAAYY